MRIQATAFIVGLVFLTPAIGLSDPGPSTAPVQTSAKASAPTLPFSSGAVAPVDDYFGRYGQSVLEVRNRIVTIQNEPDAALRTSDGLGSIERVDDAVIAWKTKYPHDPWLASVLAHLFECYVRAGAAHNAHATALLGALVANFPDSQLADEALRVFARADVPSLSAAVPVATIVSGKVIDAVTTAPIVGALVLLSDGENIDPATAPFATTTSDGSFRVQGVTNQTKFMVVDPPHGSQYNVYRSTYTVTSPGLMLIKLTANAALASNVQH